VANAHLTVQVGDKGKCRMRRTCSEANRAGQDARPAPPPGGLTPDPPVSLGAVGSAVWTTIAQAGSYQDNDAPVLERYCQLHDRRAVLLALVDTEGYSVAGSKQQPTAHPATRLARDIDAQMTQLESVLALNPEARARLGLATACA
jgi:P27 family predicted phage terminase small subunit